MRNSCPFCVSSFFAFFFASFAFLFALFFVGTSPLQAQAIVTKTQQEVGISLEISSPLPSSELAAVLNPNLGLGFFYRGKWPGIFQTEVGLAWFFLDSNKPQKLLLAPVYAALGYRLPFESRLETFLKAGFGASYLEVRPTNVHGWDPLLFLGLELSILATRFLRIGIRLDYLYIYDGHLKVPEDIREGPSIPSHVDERFQGKQNFIIHNGHFARFGVLFAYGF